jgi:hypothetical protein
MATKTQGKAGVVVRAQALIAGTTKHLASTTQVTLVGETLTPAQVVAKLQALVDLRTAVDSAKATAKAKLVAEESNAPPLLTFLGAFAAYVKAAYLNSPDVLSDFGLNPKSRTAQTVETKAVAAAKRAATRAARHTLGSKQRAVIKGDVTGVTLTPVVATPPTPATPSSPSAPATGGTATATPAPHTT